MPAMTHLPGKVIAQLLVDLGQGSAPDVPPGEWPVHWSTEPNLPDNCITVYDTQGNPDGRIHRTGEIQEHPGIMVRVRSALPKVGAAKANAVRTALAEEVKGDGVTVDTSSYVIENVSPRGNVLPLGRETPTSNRRIFTFNAIVSLYQQT